jgi:hypothetical protein
MADPRGDRLQIMLTSEEVRLLDDWRFSHRMPSRSAAVRELLHRGLAAEGFITSDAGSKSKDYGVGPRAAKHDGRGGNGSAKDGVGRANAATRPR